MTYKEVLDKYPDEHEQRYQDKFKYRSPRGEVCGGMFVRLLITVVSKLVIWLIS